MKKLTLTLAALLVCGVAAHAGVLSTAWTLRNVVDPPDLRDGLIADSTAADTRLDAIEASGVGVAAALTVGSISTTGTVTISEGALTDSTVVSADVKDDTLVNADINSAAAIASSKLSTVDARTVGSLTTTGAVGIAEGALTDSTVVSADIKNDSIVDADINSAAAIASSKLATTDARTVGSLTTTGAVGIAEGALTDSTVVSADVKDDTLVNADVNSAAAIASSKLAQDDARTVGSISTTGTVSIAAGALTDKAVVAADLADAVQDMLIQSFAAVAVPGSQGTTNVVTVTAKDIGGNTLATRTSFRCWVADSDYGVPAAVDVSFEVSTGVEVQKITDKAHYIVLSDGSGVAVLNIQDSAGRTNYLHIVNGGGTVSSTTLLWDTP